MWLCTWLSTLTEAWLTRCITIRMVGVLFLCVVAMCAVAVAKLLIFVGTAKCVWQIILALSTTCCNCVPMQTLFDNSKTLLILLRAVFFVSIGVNLGKMM